MRTHNILESVHLEFANPLDELINGIWVLPQPRTELLQKSDPLLERSSAHNELARVQGGHAFFLAVRHWLNQLLL